MYEKNSKTLDDKDLEKAAGGGFYVDNGGFLGWNDDDYYDQAGNYKGSNLRLSDARANAEKYGGFAVKATKDDMDNLRNNGWVKIGNKVYYKDGSSRVVQ